MARARSIPPSRVDSRIKRETALWPGVLTWNCSRGYRVWYLFKENARLISKRLLSIVLPIVVIIAAVLASKWIKASKPEPETRSKPARLMQVDAIRLKTAQYPVMLRSQGSVQPTLTNALVPEVGGTVVSLAKAFVVGGRFKAGDVLVQIDRRDYDIALTQAEANLAQADARLQEQAALAERAREDWRLLGRSGKPSALTLREPQLAAAKADRDAAEAQLSRAQLDVDRTQLSATFDGIVGEKSVDTGQFVARGTLIGRIHAIDSAEVRLPVSSQYLDLLNLRGDASVRITASVGGARDSVWKGVLTRVEGMDAASQQLTVVAQISDPYATATATATISPTTTENPPLRFGQFVQAEISGKTLNDVFVIPRSALREEREVLLVDSEGRIERRDVQVVWSDEDSAAISTGLQVDELLVTTPLSTVADGTPVSAMVDGVLLSGNEPDKGTESDLDNDQDTAN